MFNMVRFTPNGSTQTKMEKDAEDIKALADLPRIVRQTIAHAHINLGSEAYKLVRVEKNPDGTVDVLTEGTKLFAA